MREDVCTYIRAVGNLRTGKYQQGDPIQDPGLPEAGTDMLSRMFCGEREGVIDSNQDSGFHLKI